MQQMVHFYRKWKDGREERGINLTYCHAIFILVIYAIKSTQLKLSLSKFDINQPSLQ